jgi:hypothetical protein
MAKTSQNSIASSHLGAGSYGFTSIDRPNFKEYSSMPRAGHIGNYSGGPGAYQFVPKQSPYADIWKKLLRESMPPNYGRPAMDIYDGGRLYGQRNKPVGSYISPSRLAYDSRKTDSYKMN